MNHAKANKLMGREWFNVTPWEYVQMKCYYCGLVGYYVCSNCHGRHHASLSYLRSVVMMARMVGVRYVLR